ncbi:TetR/AcrR family transcriptional regulator [Mycobacterium sp. MMS18-G62]
MELVHDVNIMVKSQKVRRAGYAPTSVELGRRGLHTRESILHSGARLFLDRGFHGTSIDAIAKAAGASRATVYQYFQDKDDIYRELAAQCVPEVLEHAARLGPLGPDAAGIQNLYQWLDQWTTLYDENAVVLLAFPGLGFSTSIAAAPDSVSDGYLKSVTDRTRQAGVEGIAPEDAAAAVVRIAHMVNFYRYRGMWDLPDAHAVTASLTVALQLLLFPGTPPAVRDLIRVPTDPLPASTYAPRAVPSVPSPAPSSPIRSDIVAAAASLFAEHGYYAVAMDDIGAAAGVSRATLYRHFRTKVAILSELTQRALAEGVALATDLHELADRRVSRNSLHAWLRRYVGFHRRYGSVTQTWYDGGLNGQLADAITAGLGPFQEAATALLNRSGLPEEIDLRVGAAIFLAVLGRLTELTSSRRTAESDYDTADLMLLVISRALSMKFETEPT